MTSYNMTAPDLMRAAEQWRKEARTTCAKHYLAVIPKKRYIKHCLKQAKHFDALYERKVEDPSLILP